MSLPRPDSGISGATSVRHFAVDYDVGNLGIDTDHPELARADARQPAIGLRELASLMQANGLC